MLQSDLKMLIWGSLCLFWYTGTQKAIKGIHLSFNHGETIPGWQRDVEAPVCSGVLAAEQWNQGNEPQGIGLRVTAHVPQRLFLPLWADRFIWCKFCKMHADENPDDNNKHLRLTLMSACSFFCSFHPCLTAPRTFLLSIESTSAEVRCIYYLQRTEGLHEYSNADDLCIISRTNFFTSLLPTVNPCSVKV